MEGNAVAGLVVDGKMGLFEVRAKIIVDASGDLDIAAKAGAPYEHAGKEGPVQSATTTFTLAGVDVERAAQVSRAEFEAMMREANLSGAYRLPREEGSVHRTPHPGVMVANMTRVPNVDGTDPFDLSRAEIEGRRQVQEDVRLLVDQVAGDERAELIGPGKAARVRERGRHHGEGR